jgi:hypothetical protein
MDTMGIVSQAKKARSQISLVVLRLVVVVVVVVVVVAAAVVE